MYFLYNLYNILNIYWELSYPKKRTNNLCLKNQFYDTNKILHIKVYSCHIFNF